MPPNIYKLTTLYSKYFFTMLRFQQQVVVHPSRGYMCSLPVKELTSEDTFGSLSENQYKEMDEEPIIRAPYASVEEIKALLGEHNYSGAKDLLKNVSKRSKNLSLIYNIMISYNATYGQVKEAFKLYNDYKKIDSYVPSSMYAILFKACTKAANSKVALEIADKVATHLFESQHVKPNIIHYNAMIMAYGRHGDLKTAILLSDKLGEQKSNWDIRSYNYLLSACISDKNSGLRIALLMWQYMLKKNIKPNLYSFSVMARIVRDCSLGDTDLIESFLKVITGKHKEYEKDFQKVLSSRPIPATLVIENIKDKNEQQAESTTCGSEEITANNEVVSNVCPVSDQVEVNKFIQLPSLLAPSPEMGSILHISDYSTAVNRFMIIGGLKRFFEVMDQYEVKPDVNLCSTLLECLPSTTEAEEELLNYMKRYNLKFSTSFVNVLIKRKIKKDRNGEIQDYIKLFEKYQVMPCIISFGCLAMLCTNKEKGIELFELLRQYKIRPNIVIMETVLRNAVTIKDAEYVSLVLKVLKEENIESNVKFIVILRKFLKTMKPDDPNLKKIK